MLARFWAYAMTVTFKLIKMPIVTWRSGASDEDGYPGTTPATSQDLKQHNPLMHVDYWEIVPRRTMAMTILSYCCHLCFLRHFTAFYQTSSWA